MTRLVIHKDPSGALGRIISDVRPGQCALDILATIDGFDHHNSTVLINGKKVTFPSFLGDHMIDRGDEELLTKKLYRYDYVNVIMETRGLEIIAYAALAISLIATVYMLVTMPKPEDPKAANSTNNDLYGQTNTARPYEAIPDIYGTVVSYPDLVQANVTSSYLADKKTIQQVLCIGIGYYQIEDEKLGTTLLSQLRGTTVELFEPDEITGITTIPDYVEHFECPNISNQDLDEDTSGAGPSYNFDSIGILFVSYDSTSDRGLITGLVNADEPGFAVGDILNFTTLLTEAEPTVIDLSGAYTVTSVTYEPEGGSFGLPPSKIIIALANASVVNPNFALIPDDESKNLQSPGTVTTTTSSNIIGPFDIGSACQKIAVDIVYNGGLNDFVQYTFTADEITKPGGVPVNGGISVTDMFYHSVGVSEDDIERRAFTDFVELSTDKRYYRVSLKRITPHYDALNRQNRGKVERIAAVNEYAEAQFNNVTMLRITSEQQKGSVSPRDNLYNAKVTRKTITYDMATGDIDYTLRPSKRFADALLHESVVVFGRNPAELDLDGLYAIQNSIDSKEPLLGEFCYTFDDKSVGYRDRYETICNAARVTVFNNSGLYMFTRDDAQKFVAGVITKRDIASDRQYSRSFKAMMPGKNDCVRLEYVDPETNKKAYVFKSFDTDGTIIDAQGVNPKQIQLTGCRNFTQAENRAILECTRILKTHYAVSDTLTSVGSQLNIGDLVLYADTFRTDISSGEIIGRNEGVLTLSEPFNYVPGHDYEIVFNDELGDVYGPYEVIASADRFSVEIDGYFANDTFTSYLNEMQLGSRYIISEVGERPTERMVVTEKKGASDGSVNVTLVSMVDSLYSFESWYYQTLAFTALTPQPTTGAYLPAMSYDGNMYLAGQDSYLSPSGLYILTASGWFKSAIPGNRGVFSVAADNDNVIMGHSAGYLSYSTDGGYTLSVAVQFLNSGMTSGDIDAFDTGRVIACHARAVSSIAYAIVGNDWASKSENGGATWAALPAGLGLPNTSSYKSIACSDSGDVVVIGGTSYPAVSYDAGATWAELGTIDVPGEPSPQWARKVALSGDGLTMVAHAHVTDGIIAVSTDAFATYIVTDVGSLAGSTSTYEPEFTVSSDGTRILVVFGDGKAAYSEDAGQNWTTGFKPYLSAPYTEGVTNQAFIASDLNSEKILYVNNTGGTSVGNWV